MQTTFTIRFLASLLSKEVLWTCLTGVLIFSGAFRLQAQEAFITTWQVTAADLSVRVPTHPTSTYNYDVNWGDGNSSTGVTGDATHTYSAAGTYTISITGTFPRIRFNNTGDKSKIMTIEQWGDIAWTSMEEAFFGCNNLTIPATDAPDLSGVTSIRFMLNRATSFNQPINHWDVSNITDMALSFSVTSSFNKELNNWDVSNVTNMQAMFSGSAFNQSLSTWNVSKVTNMLSMFRDCPAFNQDLSNWNVSKVTTMFFMFQGAASFNQSLAEWDISSVGDMNGMLNSIAMSEENYEATLIGWATLSSGETKVPTGILLSAFGQTHCGIIERIQLARPTESGGFGWTITGDTESCTLSLAVIESKMVNEDESLEFMATPIYEGVSTLLFSLDATSLSKDMSIHSTTGAFTWNPTEMHVSEHTVTISVSNGVITDSESFTITVNAVNDAPILAAIGNQEVDEDVTISFTVSATDEEDDELTFNLDEASSGKGMTLDAITGAFAWTPTQVHVGEHSVTITVSDGELTDSETFSITVNNVNDAPVLSSIGNQSTDEEIEFTFTATATDEDDDPLTFSLDANSLTKGMTIGESSGVFLWTPTAAQVGDHEVTISVSDGLLEDSETIVVTVVAVNKQPVLAFNAGITVIQGQTAVITSSHLSVTDVDNTPAELVYTITQTPTHGNLKKESVELNMGSTFTQADINADQLSYDHDGFNGSMDKFTFTVSDGNGGTIAATDFNITIDIVTGLETAGFLAGISIFPNPVESSTTIRVSNSHRGSVQYTLTDLSGKRMQQRTAFKNEEIIELPVDLSAVPSALLILRITMLNQTALLKLVRK